MERMSRRLLVHVDDDPDLAFLLDRALSVSGLANWDFKHVQGGPAALEYLARVRAETEHPPTLLLLDIKMPGVTGLDVLEWVSQNLPGIPAVMLSSSELLEDRLRARDLGSRGYFSKAAIFTELLEFLRAWDETALARRPRTAPSLSDPPLT
jgi:two-component system, NtrC family, nitrogen regulation response regulator GlnG